MVVILTALELEYTAVREHLTNVRRHVHPAGTWFEVGTINGRRVAIALIGKGNTMAATITERAIAEFEPDLVLFVGVAGALKASLGIGDIVVATKVYAYHGGYDGPDGFNARPRAFEAPHHVEQIARHVAMAGEWPPVHFYPIAAGEIVKDAKKSELADLLRTHYNDAVAIEMESAGVAHAAHLNRASTMTIRAISDHSDGRKQIADRAGSQRTAARNAAAFAAAVIAELEDIDDPPPRGLRVENIFTGTANNVIQGGVVNGDVHFGRDA